MHMRKYEINTSLIYIIMINNVKCPKHPDQETRFYCKKHDLWICEYCFKTHKECGFPIHYTEILEEAKVEVAKEPFLDDKLASILENAKTKIQELKGTLSANTDSIVTKLNQYKEKLSNTAGNTKTEKGTLAEAIKYTESKGMSMDPSIAEVEKIFTNLDSVIKKAKIDVLQPFESLNINVSTIVGIEGIVAIKNWIGGSPQLMKLYNAKIDGFAAKNFHSKCDGKKPTVVIAQTSFGKIIGGYSTLPWESSANEYTYGKDTSLKCFLFSITLNKMYKNTNSEYSICNSQNHGPKFGGGHDLEIVGDCNTKENQYSGIGHSYDKEDITAYYGGTKFTIENYEVFEVKL